MKPLLAKFVPAMVSEQPMSAAEDARLWRGTTGLHLLEGGAVDEEKQEDEDGDKGRRDTAVAMSARRVQVPRKVLILGGVRDVRVRWSW
jgi:hypothetical protein